MKYGRIFAATPGPRRQVFVAGVELEGPGPIFPDSSSIVPSRHPVSTPRTQTCPRGPRYASLLTPRFEKNWLPAPPSW
jgi:hypothetical protein